MTTTTETRTSTGPLVLRPREVRALILAPDRRTRRGKRDAALLAVLACGGLRVGEACRLTVDCLDDTRQAVRITTRTAKTHGQRSRTVSLVGQPAQLVRGWLAESQPRLWLFAGRRNEHLSVSQAQRIVKAHLLRVGRSDLHTHSLRHSCLSIIVRETGNLFAAQRIAGHADPRTTAKFYLAFDVRDADNAANAINEAMTRRAR